eukprot:scaffold12669_cov149-Skeletonema_menzelii.AAC.1
MPDYLQTLIVSWSPSLNSGNGPPLSLARRREAAPTPSGIEITKKKRVLACEFPVAELIRLHQGGSESKRMNKLKT